MQLAADRSVLACSPALYLPCGRTSWCQASGLQSEFPQLPVRQTSSQASSLQLYRRGQCHRPRQWAPKNLLALSQHVLPKSWRRGHFSVFGHGTTEHKTAAEPCLGLYPSDSQRHQDLARSMCWQSKRIASQIHRLWGDTSPSGSLVPCPKRRRLPCILQTHTYLATSPTVSLLCDLIRNVVGWYPANRSPAQQCKSVSCSPSGTSSTSPQFGSLQCAYSRALHQ